MSSEPGAETIFRALQIDPVIHAGMHLGEGTGAAALFPLLDMCADVYYGMATFDGISVPAYEDYHKKETR
jgi:nicotinate-nucleotide--dimethylbenzimidazole phosphoribosyltransferase